MYTPGTSVRLHTSQLSIDLDHGCHERNLGQEGLGVDDMQLRRWVVSQATGDGKFLGVGVRKKL